MKKLTTLPSGLLIFLALIGLFMALPEVKLAVAETTYMVCPTLGTGCTHTSIQAAIDAASDGDVIEIQSGTYSSSTINITKPVTIRGIGINPVIIRAGASGGYGVDVSADGFFIENVTIENNNNAIYGLKISGSDNVTVKNVEIKNYVRSGLDLIGCNNALIEGVNSHHNGGAGIAVSNSTNITLRDNTTSNNGWGGVGLFTNKNYYINNLSGNKTGLDGVILEGNNTFNEINPLYTELADSSHVIRNFTQTEYAYVVRNTALPLVTWYQKTKDSAKTLINAAGLTFKSTAAIQQLSDSSFHVFDTMKIQPAIDLASVNGIVLIYPGTYNEIAQNRFVLGTNGPHQFGLFIADDKDGIRLIGVDSNGDPIEDYSQVEATITTNATNNFGYAGIFIEADDATIQGLKIGPNTPSDNKTIEVIGDGFTLQYSHIAVPDRGSVYINDWRFDNITQVSHVKSYFIEDNWFEFGSSVDIASGAGYSGDKGNRRIIGNKFTGNDGVYWALVSFNGHGEVPWFTYPIGGAIVQDNEFSGSTQYIRARSNYDNAQFDWKAFWEENTFDKAVVTLADVATFDVRAYSYTSGSYSFTNVRRIGSLIQGEVNNSRVGDSILIKPGDYKEQVVVEKNLSLIGSGRNTVIRSPATLPSTYLIGSNTYKPVILVKDASNVILQDLVVDGDGKGNANHRFVGVGYFNSGGLISNVEIKKVQDTPFSGVQHGVALYIYNGDGQEREVEVKDSKLVDFQKNGTAFHGSNLTVNFHNNEVVGKWPTPTTAQNGIQFSGGASGEVKGNTVTGIAYTGANWTASGILLYGVGNVTVEDNDLNNCQTSIYLYGGSSVITNNVITTSKAGIGWGSYLTGIAAADPPFLPPSPIETTTSLDQSSARNATNDVSIMDSGDVVVIQNNIVNGGGDDPTSVGIGAWAGYTDEDVSFSITDNNVFGWGFGLDISKCVSGCRGGEFSSITLKQNKVHQNDFGMYTNVEVDASLNWWGTLSWYGYGSVTGIKDIFVVEGDGAVDWQPWRNEDLTLSLDIPTITYADDDNAGKAEGEAGANGGTFGYDAFASIQDALNHVAPGGMVYVGAGNYSGNIQINKAVTVIGQSRPMLDGRFWVDANNVTIQGFEIRNGRASTGVDQSGVYVSSAQNVTIRDNHLIGSWTGGETNFVGGRGILTSGNVGNLVVEGNTIEKWVSGLYLNPTSGLIIVRNNEIGGNWAGAGTDRQGNIQFRNNYFRNNIEGIGASKVGASFVVEENAFIGNTTAVNHYSGSQIKAQRNWWASPSGPTNSGNSGGSGQPVVGAVDFAPWLCDGSDTQPTQIGFQPAADAAGCTVTSRDTRLVFTQYPDGGFENVPFATQPVVRAEDDDGNLAVNFNGLVNLYLANNPAGGVLQGRLFVNAVNGVATFSGVSISKAGENYQLVANSPGPDRLVPAVGGFFDVLPQNADLAVSIDATPNPVGTGAALAYTVRVQNLGPLAASSLSLTVNLPSGVTFLNAGGTGWTCLQSGGVVTCTRSSLAATSSAPNVTITVNAPNQAGSITAIASITATTLDLVSDNNQASVDTLVVTIPETGGITIYLPLVKK